MDVSETVLQEYSLQDEELEEVFNNLKSNKSPRLDDISSSVVNFCIGGVFHPLKRIFNLSLQIGVFPNAIKIVRDSPIFKKDEEFLYTNYRPILPHQYFRVSQNY